MPAGTRFRLFPQHPSLSSSEEPETILVSPPPGAIGPGPSDERMYTILPVGKPPYSEDFGPYFPPWTGPMLPPALPGRDGHFDHLAPGTPQFEAAHLFGSVCFTLDIWEGYFGRPIPWHFAERYDRLELAPLPGFDNAQAGYGYIETGEHILPGGRAVSFSLNFDIIAHELGHLILYQEIGQPTEASAGGEYYGFHEAAADLVGLLAAAHFESVINPLLENTRGNLYVFNRLNRIGEVSDNDQIRLAGNGVRLAEFQHGWDEEHDLSLPLTGAMFDILVDIFHELLLERGLISSGVEDLADQVERVPEFENLIQSLFDRAYARNPPGFRRALLDARDTLGVYLAATWQRLSPHHLTYADVARAMIEVDDELTGGRYRRLISHNFALRDIGSVEVGPRLASPDENSHAFSSRTLAPQPRRQQPFAPYRTRWQLARQRTGSIR
ncbi:MAG: hypothetical protein ACREJ0_05950 [Geminicoccaceae bacterium]